MRIGIFGDAHDHLDNVRSVVEEFNRADCDLAVFAGDFCSPIVIPPLRKLHCRVLACFGDNDGNKVGLAGGMRIVGSIAEPPFGFQTADGVRILVTHVLDALRGFIDGCHVVISCHTHRADIRRDEQGRLFINPGETAGWTYRKPSVAILETDPLSADIIRLNEPSQVSRETDYVDKAT